MGSTSNSIVLMCLQIIPFILLLGSLLTFRNLVNLGPRELPRKHPLNRKMAVPVIIVSVGMFMIPIPDFLGILGIILCVIGILWYGKLFREAREEYPPLTDAEWLKIAKARFGRMRDYDVKDQEDKKNKGK